MNENNLFNLDSFLEQEDGNAGELPFPEVIPMPTVASKALMAETAPQKMRLTPNRLQRRLLLYRLNRI